MSGRDRLLALAGLVTVIALAVGAYVFVAPRPDNQLQFDKVDVRVIELASNVAMLVSVAGNVSAGNAVIQWGDEGVLIVDTQYHQLGEKLLSAIRTRTLMPVRYVINTHMHIDHVGGNEYLATNGDLPDESLPNPDRAPVLAHDNVLVRLMRPPPLGRRPGVWPSEVYTGTGREFRFNDDLVRVIHAPRSHTDGDSIIHFVQANVIVTGDVFNNAHYPFINHANGGSLEGMIQSLGMVADLAATTAAAVVPGHGEVADADSVLMYRDMLITIRDRVAMMIDAEMSLDEIKRAEPTREFDDRFGQFETFPTTSDFIDAVYLQLVEEAKRLDE